MTAARHTDRSVAVIMAGYRGDETAAVNALNSPRPSDRIAALGALNRIGTLPPALLRSALADPHGGVCHRALGLIAGHSQGAELLDDVVACLAQDELAEHAAFVLGELNRATPEVTAALETQSRAHDDPLCRESAVAALGSLGVGLDTILAATEDIATVRRRAVIALAPFDTPEVAAALQKATTDRDWQVRQAAEDLLAVEDL